MPRVSRYKLKQEEFEKIYQLFFEIVSKGQSRDEFASIMDGILTHEERVMIAKRVAVLYLLGWEVGQVEIAKKLHMSTATVNHYATLSKITNSSITKVINRLKANRQIVDLFKDLFADLFIQPGLKRGHWDLYWNDQKRRGKKRTGSL